MVLGLIMPMAACSSTSSMDHQTSYYDEISDPLEPVNRAIFSFNGVVDTFIIRPIAEGYRYVLPEAARDSVQNFVRNLRTPINLVNQVLQADFGGAADTTGRFLVNSTVGVAGLFDVAEGWGMPYEQEDFGQTLAVWGVPNGPYLVIPIMGPSNVRDTVGMVGDIAADPFVWNANSTHNDTMLYAKAGLATVDNRARLIDPLDELRRDSIDYYAAIRSVYTQFRHSQINDSANGTVMGKSTADIPDYDEYDSFAYEE